MLKMPDRGIFQNTIKNIYENYFQQGGRNVGKKQYF